MKLKSLNFLFLLILFFGITVFFLFKIRNLYEGFLFAILYGGLVGLTFGLYHTYTIPNQWFYKFRFWIEGSVFGILIAVMNSNEIKSITAWGMLNRTLIGIFIGITIFGTIRYQRFKSMKKGTPLDLEDAEIEIISSVANLNNEDIAKNGRLILTNKRLVFIAEDKSETIEFRQLPQNLQLVKRVLFSKKIYIPENDTSIGLAFPLFWKKEIERVLI
jgi:hypothetical protein